MDNRYMQGKYDRMKRNLKAALLLNEKIIFRASAAVKSYLTEKLILEAKDFVEEGILIPEYRKGAPPLEQQVESLLKMQTKSSKKIKRKKSIAELIDNSPVKLELDGIKVSDKRSFQLVFHLFKLKLNPLDYYLKSNISWSDIEDILKKLKSERIPDRKIFIEDVKRAFRKASVAIHLIQSIYFGVGAYETDSNPVWSRELNPSINLDLWQGRLPELNDLKGESLKLAQNYNITDHLEENKAVIEHINLQIKPTKILEAIDVSMLNVEQLEWKDIINIRKKKEFVNISEYIKNNKKNIDYNSLSRSYHEQERRNKKRSKIVNYSLGILGILPTIGTLFSLLGLGKEIFSNRSKNLIKNRFPLLSYSEIIKEKIAKKQQKWGSGILCIPGK